jgi:hypothetical protein
LPLPVTLMAMVFFLVLAGSLGGPKG